MSRKRFQMASFVDQLDKVSLSHLNCTSDFINDSLVMLNSHIVSLVQVCFLMIFLFILTISVDCCCPRWSYQWFWRRNWLSIKWCF